MDNLNYLTTFATLNKTIHKDEDQMKLQSDEIKDMLTRVPYIFDEFTISSIGNLAYIILYFPYNYNKDAKRLLELFIEYKNFSFLE